MTEQRRSEGRGLITGWALLVVVCLAFCAWRIDGGRAFESNILALVPQAVTPAVSPSINTQVQALADRQFTVLLAHKDPQTGLQLARALQQTLAARRLVQITDGSEMDALQQIYFPYRYQLLAPVTRAWLRRHSPADLAAQAYQDLFSPVSNFRPYALEMDPFNLGGRWLQHFAVGSASLQPTDVPSLQRDGTTWYVLQGRVLGDPFDLAVQQALSGALNGFLAERAEARPQLLRSGMVFHAANGAHIAHQEISTVGLGSLLGIVLLIGGVFRSPRALLFIGAVLGISTVVALSSTLLLFGRVHLVTLALGSTLLGLAADYCLHFLVKQRALGSGQAASRLLRQSLILACGTTAAAYLLQLLSPFPGLQQFGVFVASGLVTACAAVISLGRLYQPAAPGPVPGKLLDHWIDAAMRLAGAKLRMGLALFTVTALCAAAALSLVHPRDDIRLLNTSGAELLAEQARVAELLQRNASQRYFLLQGDSIQKVLERREALLAQLEAISAGPAAAFSPADMTPSLAQQRRDHALVQDRLLGENGAIALLCQRLEADCRHWPGASGAWQDGLTPSVLRQHALLPAAAAELTQQGVALVVLRNDVTVSPTQIRQLEQAHGAVFVDNVGQLTTVLGHFRQQVLFWLGCFLVPLALLAWVRFRSRAPALLVPVLGAMATAMLLAAAGGVTVFHCLALLLVLGIAIDTAVIYLELGLERSTLLAASLASATSVLAFGLLALSAVPILAQIGSTVFIGLLAAWLLAPLAAASWQFPSTPPQQREQHAHH